MAGELLDEPMRRRYADAIVRTCIKLAPGDLLLVRGEPAHRELVVAVVEAGYRAGARHVEAWYVDPLVRHARVAEGGEETLGPFPRWDAARLRASIGPDAASVSIVGEEFPSLLADLPPDRVALDTRRAAQQRGWFYRAQTEQRLRFCVAAWPTEAWARTVYPDLSAAEAMQRLAADILWFCRLGPSDADDAWPRHLATLAERARLLNERPLRGLELRGGGNDLRLRLAPGTRFLTAAEPNHWGQTPCVNYPTEEVYSSPDAAGTEGSFCCSRPLSFGGRLIEGLRGEFRAGRLVRLEADDEADRDVLAGYFDADRNGRRLGEVALVDAASRIGQAGRVYEDTLIDENAATHIAFGFGFSLSRDPNVPGRGTRGVNRSSVHLDIMLGSDELDVTALEEGGARIPVIRDGVWQLS